MITAIYTHHVPPILRRPVIFCAIAIITAISLWTAASIRLGTYKANIARAQMSLRDLEFRLAKVHDTIDTEKSLDKRLQSVAALACTPPETTWWNDLVQRLIKDPGIEEVNIKTQSMPPLVAVPDSAPVLMDFLRVRVDAGLQSENALLTLDRQFRREGPNIIPVGCNLQPETGHPNITLRARCEYDWIMLAPTRVQNATTPCAGNAPTTEPSPASPKDEARLFPQPTESHQLEPETGIRAMDTPRPLRESAVTNTAHRFDGALWRDGKIVAVWIDGTSTEAAEAPTVTLKDDMPSGTVDGQQTALYPGQVLASP